MNFAYEELRQVDFARYNKKVKLRYFCSLALLFFNRVVIVRVSFSALSLVYIRISLLLFLQQIIFPLFALAGRVQVASAPPTKFSSDFRAKTSAGVSHFNNFLGREFNKN
jgi:hypothetical protein